MAVRTEYLPKIPVSRYPPTSKNWPLCAANKIGQGDPLLSYNRGRWIANEFKDGLIDDRVYKGRKSAERSMISARQTCDKLAKTLITAQMVTT